jgi:hypothetical protein
MKRNISDTVLLSGWLFADLFLGLTVIFLAALPGTQPLVQILATDTTTLSPQSQQCRGTSNIYQCTITLSARSDSRGKANWQATSDITDAVHFSPPNGTLAPSQSKQVIISGIPCQHGTFTFSGGNTTTPVTISWKCALAAQRLDFNSQPFQLTVHDISGLLNNSQSAINDIKQQVSSVSILKGRSVGLAIVYTGAPDINGTAQAQQISGKIYDVFRSLGKNGGPFQKASYYDNLYKLSAPANTVYVDVFLYTQESR